MCHLATKAMREVQSAAAVVTAIGFSMRRVDRWPPGFSHSAQNPLFPKWSAGRVARTDRRKCVGSPGRFAISRLHSTGSALVCSRWSQPCTVARFRRDIAEDRE